MITRPKTSATPTVPREPGCSASVMTAPHPAKTRAKTPRPSAATRRRSSGRSAAISAAGGCRREDPAHCVKGARSECEVAAGAARLAFDQADLEQDLQVVADGALGQTEEGLELTDADGLAVGPQEHVDDAQAVAVGQRLQHRLQLRGFRFAERAAGERGAAVDHREVRHRRASLTPSSMNIDECCAKLQVGSRTQLPALKIDSSKPAIAGSAA